MAVILRTLNAQSGLDELTTVVHQHEDLGLRLVSLAAGRLGGQDASLVTFRQGETGPPARPAQLEAISDTLNQDEQQALLNAPGRDCVCYGTLFVSGTERNIAAYR